MPKCYEIPVTLISWVHFSLAFSFPSACFDSDMFELRNRANQGQEKADVPALVIKMRDFSLKLTAEVVFCGNKT